MKNHSIAISINTKVISTTKLVLPLFSFDPETKKKTVYGKYLILFFSPFATKAFFINSHLVKSLRREIDNAGANGGDLENLDDGDV